MGCSKVVCDRIDAEDYHMNSCYHWLDQCTDCTGCKGEEGCTESDEFQGISMINPDMGLYLSFETDQNGRPVGCKG